MSTMTWLCKFALAALCVASAMHSVYAIYEEQLGEFDWKRENIGLVDRSFSLAVQSSLIVVTSKHVLASLDADTGILKWRVLLPAGTSVVKFVEVDGNVVTLSAQQQSPADGGVPVYSVLVRCWSVVDGSMLWDTFLGSYSAAEAGDFSHSEMMYVASKGLLTVLSGNALHFVTVPARTAVTSAPQYWSWSASSDSSVSEEGRTLLLSTLVAPTYIAGENRHAAQDQAFRMAVGCFSSSAPAAADRFCDGKVAVVNVRLPAPGSPAGAAGQVSTEEFPGFPAELQARPQDLTAAVSSQAALPYQTNDVVFISNALLGAEVSMTVLSLADQSLRTLHSSSADAREQPSAALLPARSFVLVSADGELRPAATACVGNLCQSFSLAVPAWALQPVSGTACAGAQSAVQHRGFPFYERIVQFVQCVSFTSLETHLRSVTVRSSDASAGSSASLDLSTMQALLPPFHVPPVPQQSLLWSASTLPVHHLQLLPATKSGCGVRLLVVLHSGVTMMLRSNCGAASNSAVVAWSRNEALASVQQALVIDSLAGSSATSTGTVTEGVAPNFLQRLAMQGIKVKNHAVKAVASAKELAATSMDAVQRLTKSGLGGRKGGGGKQPVKPRDVEKLRTFGFDKVAVLLCYSDKLASMLDNADGMGVPFSQAGLQLVFVDLLRTSASSADEEVLGVRYLSLQDQQGISAGEERDPVVTSVKLVANPAPSRRADSQQLLQRTSDAGDASVGSEATSAAARTVTLIVGTAGGRTLFWDVDPRSLLAGDATTKTCSSPSTTALVPWTASVSGPARVTGSVASVAAAFASAHLNGSRHSAKVPVYTILHTPAEGSDVTAVTLMLHSSSAGSVSQPPSDPLYVHFVDRNTGKITVFKSTAEAGDQSVCAERKVQLSTGTARSPLRLQCVAVRSSGSVFLDPAEERIVDVTYPSAADPVHVHYSILGDDSVLLKYLNPHVALVTSVAANSAPAAASTTVAAASVTPADSGDAAGADGGAASEDEGPSNAMYWTLVDTVTGRIIVRLQQDSAALPAHSVIIENHVVSTYWNSKAKRTELSSTALYEGVIDNTELTPFASSRARANSPYLSSSAAKVRSAFTSTSPIAMQKTYTLPRAVSALHHTVTAHGLSNKNLLVGLRNGQVYSVDLKQIHPRRPFSDPSPAEKTEGLVRYSPFITLIPLGALTHNYSLPGGVSHIVSAPSNLESSSLALSFGGGAVDLHLNRVMPSQDFDLLSSDFNYSLLVAILLALATAVRMLRNMQQRKHLSTIWA